MYLVFICFLQRGIVSESETGQPGWGCHQKDCTPVSSNKRQWTGVPICPRRPMAKSPWEGGLRAMESAPHQPGRFAGDPNGSREASVKIDEHDCRYPAGSRAMIDDESRSDRAKRGVSTPGLAKVGEAGRRLEAAASGAVSRLFGARLQSSRGVQRPNLPTGEPHRVQGRAPAYSL
jgi:hypothetical protein